MVKLTALYVPSPTMTALYELLLAFAVNRHGTAAWESIASELQKRTSDPNLSLTAQNCRLKYLDLKRRFVAPNDDLDDGEDAGDGKSNVDESAPLLEELRKLRVAELRREVQRYDLNIESLELKMKRMEDEREKSLRREKNESDLEKKSEEKRDVEPEAEPTSGGEPVIGEEMDKDQLSVNESNSTDPGAEKVRAGEKESEPARTGVEELRQDRTGQTSEEPAELKSEPDRKSVREDSCNGSSNSIEKSDRNAKTEPVTDSADVVESEAESDGGGEGAATKENSDVQSTASRSRKEEGSDKVRRGRTSGDEREHEDQSRAVKELSAESQPLFDFLQAIRAHKSDSKCSIHTIAGNLKISEVNYPTHRPGNSGNQVERRMVFRLQKQVLSGSFVARQQRALRLLQKRRPSSGTDKKKEQTSLRADDKDTKKPSSDAEERRSRRRGRGIGNIGLKKRGAANFLNRMKQGSSSSNNGVLLDALKNTPLTSESTSGKGGGSEQKKSENAKRGEKKEQVTRRSLETRQSKEKEKEKEKGSPGKRNVGRPPKRGAAPHLRWPSVKGEGKGLRMRLHLQNSSPRKDQGSYSEMVKGKRVENICT
ncbi:hypothetical protein DH2020_039418 [Rehmannia glutinosa]|uniref:Myb-like domain-containing protein n=1 Tax=Rehmannia glutinosa TaxID=99300 RepID=A0ABR0UW49_REHGL